jgi:hypothetical protein
MAGHLRAVDVLLRSRGDMVWAMMPYRIEIK